MRLRSPGIFITRTVFTGEQTHQNHTDDKSTDVGPPSHTSAGLRRGECRRAIKELHHEPEAEDNDGRNFDDEEKEDWHQREHSGKGIGNQVSAQYTCDRAAGADAWKR